MIYVLKAVVWRGPDQIVAESQTVSELTEAFAEQRRWLTWWETEEQYEPKRIGWTHIELHIERRIVP